jgi:predicted XRE-type DNA-binding protein
MSRWRGSTEMKKIERTALESHGWRLDAAKDFLELTPEEAAFVETKLALSRTLRARRVAQGLSQAALAKRLASSQSRVAKMEAADATVSIDLLVRGLFALGAKPRDVASAIGNGRSAAA